MISGGAIRQSDGGFGGYRLYIVTISLSLTIRRQFAVECLRRSSQRGMGHFGTKLGKGVDRCKPTFNTIWGCLMQKKSCRYLLPFEQNARTTDHGIVISIAIGEIV